MAAQKLNIYYVLGEAQEIAKTQFGNLSPFSLLFTLPLSLLIVLYPTLQHSLASTQSHSDLPFPYSGDPVVFRPLGLFLLYLFTLVCLCLCATGTVTYTVYHGSSGQPVKFIDSVKSLSNSLMRLFATFFCAQLTTLGGLAVIGLIVFGVTRGIGCLGNDSVYFGVLSVILLGLAFLYVNMKWVLAPVIVVVESSWGLEPLRRSAYLIKGKGDVGFRLLFSLCVMPWLTMIGFGSWGSFMPIGSSVYPSTLVVVMMAFGTALLSRQTLHILIALSIVYMKCREEEINQEYNSLPVDEENAPDVV